MNRSEAATAYSLLSACLGGGPGEGRVALLRASPLLDEALGAYPSLEAVEVDHEHAFGFNAPPVAGAFLDPTRRAGGDWGDRLAAAYVRIGFTPRLTGPGPEHLSTLLEALATVRVDGAFLDAHVLSWLPLVSIAVRRLQRPYPTALLEQVEGLVLLHRSDLVEPVSAAFDLPDADLDLEDPETDLRAIAEWLATPARCGVYLTRADLARIGGGRRVPRGFGDRGQLLVNLLRSAACFDALDGVVGDLEAVLDAWLEAFTAPRYSEIAEALAPWTTRAGETRDRLGALRGRAAEAAEDPPPAT